MNILTIASILPVPGVYKENDAIIRLLKQFDQSYPEHKIKVWRPSPYSNVALAKLKKKWKTYYEVLKGGSYKYDNLSVDLLPYPDLKASPAVLIKLHQAIWYLNKKKISQGIQNFEPEIVHAHWLFPDGWLAYKIFKQFNVPYVLTLRQETYFFKTTQSRETALKILNNASKVTVLNKGMQKAIASAGYNKEVHLIPHGLDEMFFRNQKKPDKKGDNASISILTVSRLFGWKNIDQVIKALHSLSFKYDFTYTIIGEGHKQQQLESLIESLNLNSYVSIKDPVPYDEIPEIMSKYDFFILTSYLETFGRVYFEAMAVGLPVICSKNSGVDGIFPNGKAGYFVDHNSVKEIESALEALIKDEEKRLKMSMNAQNIVKEYTWKNIAKKFNNIYIESSRKTSTNA